MAVWDMAILAGTGLTLAGLAFALSAALCARVARGPSFGLDDFPGGPLRHRIAVPLGGGLAVWLSTVAVLGLGALALKFGPPPLPGVIARYVDGLRYRSGEMALILGLATAVMIIGLVYDLFETGWWFRLGAQVALAAVLAASGCRVTLFWPLSYPAVGGLVTVLWVVGLTNAFTFLDNMDGLAAGVGLVASLLFAAAQAQMGGLFAPAVLLVLAGSLGGFLVYNRYPARVFLGDSGGGFIGFLLGAMTVAGTYFRYGRDDSPSGVLSPLLVMAVPLYESVWVFLFWLRERNDSFLRNRRHFSYRLRRERPDAAAGGPGGSPGVPGRRPRGAVAPPARRAGDAPGRGAVGLSDRRAGHPRDHLHQARAGTMTMDTMGCSGAAGRSAGWGSLTDLRPRAPSARIGGVGRRGSTRGRGEAMSGDLGQFLEACGASGPLRLEWDDWETGRPVARDFERPAVLVGRNPRADLVLGHPLVGLRHAYLQLVEGRLFATDLGSREGLHWGGVPRRGGWIDRSRPVQVGVTTIRVVEGDRAGDGGLALGPPRAGTRAVGRCRAPSWRSAARGRRCGGSRWTACSRWSGAPNAVTCGYRGRGSPGSSAGCSAPRWECGRSICSRAGGSPSMAPFAARSGWRTATCCGLAPWPSA